jgi:hypothetical protein
MTKDTMVLNGDGSVATICMSSSTPLSITGASTGTDVSYTSYSNLWTTPELVETNVLSDSIELIYVRHSLISSGWNQGNRQCYKIVYSCVDGKWNVSEPIIGEIFPAAKESYEFEGIPV